MYKIGRPFWKTFARIGVPLYLRVDVLRDDEAGVFVATSDDLRGLVAEAESMDELVGKLPDIIDDLLIEYLKKTPTNPPVADLRMAA